MWDSKIEGPDKRHGSKLALRERISRNLGRTGMRWWKFSTILTLAAALGAPVIGLYGPTNPARNGPYGQLDHVVESFSTTRLMQSIATDDVMRLLLKINPR